MLRYLLKLERPNFYDGDLALLLDHCLDIASKIDIMPDGASSRNGSQQAHRSEYRQRRPSGSPLNLFEQHMDKWLQAQYPKLVSAGAFFYPWINVNYPGGYNVPHTHSSTMAAGLSGVFYVSVPEDSGNIIFMKDQQTYSLTPENNMLIIFDEKLHHAVEPNFSQLPRVSIAFNFNR